MLVVTNYPQVPIATTNVATDSARVDSQQRPPVVPTPELVKSHEERPFTPQHERTAEQPEIQAKLNQRLQGKQQGSGQQQQDSPQQKEAEKTTPAPTSIKDILRNRPALSRRDVRVNQQMTPTNNNQPINEKSAALQNQPDEFYQAVAQHVSSYYLQQTIPQPQHAISSFV